MYHLYKKGNNLNDYWASHQDDCKLRVMVYDSEQYGTFLIEDDQGNLHDIFEIPTPIYDLINEGGEAVMYPRSSVPNETLVDDLAETLNEESCDMMEQPKVDDFTQHCQCQACYPNSLESQVKEALAYLDSEITQYDLAIAQAKAQMREIRKRLDNLNNGRSLTQSTKDAIIEDIFSPESQGLLEEDIFNAEEEAAMFQVHEELAQQLSYEDSIYARYNKSILKEENQSNSTLPHTLK